MLITLTHENAPVECFLLPEQSEVSRSFRESNVVVLQTLLLQQNGHRA